MRHEVILQPDGTCYNCRKPLHCMGCIEHPHDGEPRTYAEGVDNEYDHVMKDALGSFWGCTNLDRAKKPGAKNQEQIKAERMAEAERAKEARK